MPDPVEVHAPGEEAIPESAMEFTFVHTVVFGLTSTEGPFIKVKVTSFGGPAQALTAVKVSVNVPAALSAGVGV